MPVSHQALLALAHFGAEAGFKEELQCKFNASSYQSLVMQPLVSGSVLRLHLIL